MKQIIILVFLTISVVGYSNSVTNPNHEEATYYAYAGLGCLIGGSVLMGITTPFISVLEINGFGMMQFQFDLFFGLPIGYFTGLVLEKILAGVFSIYSNYLIYGNNQPTINSALFYGLSWIPTVLLTIPGYITGLVVSLLPLPLGIIGGVLFILGTLLSIVAQAGAVSIPIYVLKL